MDNVRDNAYNCVYAFWAAGKFWPDNHRDTLVAHEYSLFLKNPFRANDFGLSIFLIYPFSISVTRNGEGSL